MSAKTDEYEFIKKHWGLEEKAFGQAPRVGWGDIVGIVEAARAAGREEGAAEQREKDAEIAESKKVCGNMPYVKMMDLGVPKINGTCERIAKAIREQEEKK